MNFNYKLLIIVLNLFVFTLTYGQEKELWLSTYEGGENASGSILSVPISNNTSTIQQEFAFSTSYNGYLGRLSWIKVGSKFYSLFSTKGKYGQGGINVFDTKTEEVSVLLNFKLGMSYSNLFLSKGKLYAVQNHVGETSIIEIDLQTKEIIDIGSLIDSKIFCIATNDDAIYVSSEGSIYLYDLENSLVEKIYSNPDTNYLRLAIEGDEMYISAANKFFRLNLTTNEVIMSKVYDQTEENYLSIYHFIVHNGLIFGQIWKSDFSFSEDLFQYDFSTDEFIKLKEFDNSLLTPLFFKFNDNVCRFELPYSNGVIKSLLQYDTSKNEFISIENQLKDTYLSYDTYIVNNDIIYFFSLLSDMQTKFDNKENTLEGKSIYEEGDLHYYGSNFQQNRDKLYFFTGNHKDNGSYLKSLDILSSELETVDTFPRSLHYNNMCIESDSIFMAFPHGGFYGNGEILLYDLITKEHKTLYNFSDLDAIGHKDKLLKVDGKLYGVSLSDSESQQAGVYEFDLETKELSYLYTFKKENIFLNDFYLNDEGNLILIDNDVNKRLMTYYSYQPNSKEVSFYSYSYPEYNFKGIVENTNHHYLFLSTNYPTKTGQIIITEKDSFLQQEQIELPLDCRISNLRTCKIIDSKIYFDG